MQLNARLKILKTVLKTPYHMFSLTADKDREVMLLFEDKTGKRFSFRGAYLLDSVRNAEEYVREEIKMGSLKASDKIKEVLLK